MDIYTASIHQLAATHYSPSLLNAWGPAPPNPDRWNPRLASLKTIVAEADSFLGGFASHTNEGYLDFLFTHPSVARRGVATRLYLEIEAAHQSTGTPRIFTHSSLAARPFFLRHGFQVDTEESVDCRGESLRRFAMHKPLIPD